VPIEDLCNVLAAEQDETVDKNEPNSCRVIPDNCCDQTVAWSVTYEASNEGT